MLLQLAAALILAATYYVRTDGGSTEQCSGLANAPYSGSGSGAACAWDHPFRALPPHGAPRIASGDTLLVGSGSYMMGFGAPGAERCEAAGAFDCVMPPVPSGTKILGDCVHPPELWGTERADRILDLTGAHDVEIACLEITDHSGCVEFHSGGIACDRDEPPFGPWAARGIYAADASNVVLRRLDIHGLAAAGVHAGRLADWTVEDVRVVANGWVGWDGDIDGDDSSSGVLRFTRWTVAWNGCGETWPGKEPYRCWAQTAGGYGDGVGTGDTRGHWIIEESAFLHNTSDGLDLLYARPGSTIEIRRTIAEGNAGNQIKTAGPVTIENSVIVANCGFFDGAAFTHHVDNCRAAGGALSVFLFRGDRASVFNTTIAGEGDCLVLAGCREGGGCDGSEDVVFRNNLFVAAEEFLDPADLPCLIYTQDIAPHVVDADYSLVYGVKQNTSACPGPHATCGLPPGLRNASIDAFDARLTGASPAIDRGTSEGAPRIDFTGAARDATPDVGAYEYRPPPTRRRVVRH